MIQFLVPRQVAFTMKEYLEHWGRELADRIAVRHYEDWRSWTSLPPGTYVFAALDQLYPEGRRFLRELAGQLGSSSRVINSPETALLRYRLLEELHRRGLNRFRAVRASDPPEGLRFPVFVREEHWHTGAITPLLRTPAELRAALSRKMIRGHRLNDLLVVEFCETAEPDGLYRKYSAFAVGSKIIPRDLEHGRNWMVKHRQSDTSAASLREARSYVYDNPHEELLRQIFRIAGVDYGRIDYGMLDGTVQTWEINLNPTIGRGLRPPSGAVAPELRPLREEIKKEFYRRFRRALEALDVVPRNETEIAIRWSPEALRWKRPILRSDRESRWRAAMKKTLRPIRPTVDRVVGALSPVIVRARRREG